jgi:hypothetical protein
MKQAWLGLVAASLLLAPAGMAEARKKKKDADAGFVPGPPVSTHSASGVERIMSKDARTVMAYLGRPVLDVREETGRKLQFSNRDCILDAFLYPAAPGKEPVVTYVTARVPDGRDAERNSCIVSLSRG